VTLPDGRHWSGDTMDCRSNLDVRKAITMGIDRQTIVDTLLEGKTIVPASLWPNSSWNNDSLTPYPYDPDAAMALLEGAGYTDADGDGIREGECNGETVPLSFTYESTNSPIRIDIGVAVQLAEIGVEFAHSPLPLALRDPPRGQHITWAPTIGGLHHRFLPRSLHR
jgi:peptide/nickel transport system substrate-binding protein